MASAALLRPPQRRGVSTLPPPTTGGGGGGAAAVRALPTASEARQAAARLGLPPRCQTHAAPSASHVPSTRSGRGIPCPVPLCLAPSEAQDGPGRCLTRGRGALRAGALGLLGRRASHFGGGVSSWTACGGLRSSPPAAPRLRMFHFRRWRPSTCATARSCTRSTGPPTRRAEGGARARASWSTMCTTSPRSSATARRTRRRARSRRAGRCASCWCAVLTVESRTRPLLPPTGRVYFNKTCSLGRRPPGPGRETTIGPAAFRLRCQAKPPPVRPRTRSSRG